MRKHTLFIIAFLLFSNFVFSQIDHWETAVYASDVWKYRIGTSNPPPNWNTMTFSDTGWQSGMGGFGYADGDDNTIISPALSVYIRRKFDVADLAKIEMAILHADYDDAFVAYINGVEVGRSNNIEGMSPSYNAPVLMDHEAVMYNGGQPEAFILNKEILDQIALATENVLAIQVHNFNGLSSSDLSSNFFLSFAINDGSNDYGPTPAWFTSPFFSSHLPILQINTNGAEIPDEPSIPAEMGIVWNGVGQSNNSTGPPNEFLGNITIERRGQSSLWVFPKNGFAIETKDNMGEDMDTSFLNFPKEEDWVLHGPYSDKTLMRNVLAMDIANRMGQYASRTRFVELFINGQYEGIYVLMEKIKKDNERVDIADLNEMDISGDELTGGYIFKIDKGDTDWYSIYNMANNSGAKLQFQYVYPKRSKIQPEQENYIQSYVDSFEHALANINYLYAGKRYDDYIDLESFADHFIINELSKDVDAYRISSYMHKDKDSKGGKIKAGPVWDFNLAFGNADYCQGATAAGWVYNIYCGNTNPFWWGRMFQDEKFKNTVKCRWGQFRNGPLHLDSLNAFIDGQATFLAPALENNFNRWPILQEYIWPNAAVPGSYQGEINYMKSFLENRIAWMDNNIFGNCFPTSTNEINGDYSFEINPNPASGIIYLKTGINLKYPTEFILLNSIGQRIKSFSINHSINQFSIDLSELNNGVYFLINSQLGKDFSKKIIVQK